MFDDKFQLYQKFMEEVQKMPTVKDQDCIRLQMSSLQHSVQQHVQQWITIYGKLLHDSASSGLYALRDDMEVRELSVILGCWPFKVILVNINGSALNSLLFRVSKYFWTVNTTTYLQIRS